MTCVTGIRFDASIAPFRHLADHVLIYCVPIYRVLICSLVVQASRMLACRPDACTTKNWTQQNWTQPFGQRCSILASPQL
jgi:hypothetical protein